VEWDRALVIVNVRGVGDMCQHSTLSVGNLLVQDLKAGGLRMTAVTQDMADGSKVLGSTIRAGKHYDRPDTGEFPPPALTDHPGQEPLQDEAALAVRHERDV
jgi:hypothetical protein